MHPAGAFTGNVPVLLNDIVAEPDTIEAKFARDGAKVEQVGGQSSALSQSAGTIIRDRCVELGPSKVNDNSASSFVLASDYDSANT